MNRALLQPVRSVWEYLKEISGENAYDRYLERHRATHPGKEPLGAASSTAGARTRSTPTPAAVAHDEALADRSVREDRRTAAGKPMAFRPRSSCGGVPTPGEEASYPSF